MNGSPLHNYVTLLHRFSQIIIQNNVNLPFKDNAIVNADSSMHEIEEIRDLIDRVSDMFTEHCRCRRDPPLQEQVGSQLFDRQHLHHRLSPASCRDGRSMGTGRLLGNSMCGRWS